MRTPATTTSATDTGVSAATHERLTALLERYAARRRMHHVSLALASGDGRQHWAGACGPAAADPPLHPQTPFFVASITKRFIITLVLQADERGELDLDAPITSYLPEQVTTGLHVLDGTDRTAAITVRHLASHTSGLPDFFERRRGEPSVNQHLGAGTDVGWTFEDVLDITRSQQRPHFRPQDLSAARQRARYSDTGFQLLIQILQAISGRTFAELLTARILEPLDLRHTWLPGDLPPAPDTPAPLPLHAGRRPVQLPALIAATNDLVSTTADLLKFQRALLAGELFEHAGTADLLTERRNRLANIPVLEYGLGTMFFTVNRLLSPTASPLTLVGHSGGTGTWLFHCPELDVHLAGTVDQTNGRAIPFRLMARCLRIWGS
ncbi:MAG TPA: serine hydrolase domain-containing protein [Beutenbergiaceae bacterium]|nr:serine hydrolase domain-containing protein [Beutenbergiaceae bacterium]